MNNSFETLLQGARKHEHQHQHEHQHEHQHHLLVSTVFPVVCSSSPPNLRIVCARRSRTENLSEDRYTAWPSQGSTSLGSQGSECTRSCPEIASATHSSQGGRDSLRSVVRLSTNSYFLVQEAQRWKKLPSHLFLRYDVIGHHSYYSTVPCTLSHLDNIVSTALQASLGQHPGFAA